MPKRKILILTQDFSKPCGGLYLFIKILSSEIEKRGKNCKIVSLYGNVSNNEKEIYLNTPRLFDEPLISLYSLKRIFKESRTAQIVHVNNLFTIGSLFELLAARFGNKNIVSTFHSMFDTYGENKVKSFLNLSRNFLIANLAPLFIRKFIFLTNAQRENFCEFCIFDQSVRIKSSVINNFISEKFIITKHKKRSKLKVLYVGRLSKPKGFLDIISLSRKLKKEGIKFTAIGKKELKLSSSKLKNIKLIEELNNNQIGTYLARNNVLILPSYTESFGLVILEAMAKGLVVLASNLPTIREYFINYRNGYLFPPGDIEKMKEIILYLKNNPKEIERISKNNLKDIWKFTAEKQIPKYIRVYEEVLKENNNK